VKHLAAGCVTFVPKGVMLQLILTRAGVRDPDTQGAKQAIFRFFIIKKTGERISFERPVDPPLSRSLLVRTCFKVWQSQVLYL
jgi:hypothetical protein